MNIHDIVIGEKPHKDLSEKELKSIRIGSQRDGDVNPHDHAETGNFQKLTQNKDE